MFIDGMQVYSVVMLYKCRIYLRAVVVEILIFHIIRFTS